ncbi:hypothetical protein RB601_005846 [Gaeumannomyces tritici]
MTMAVPHAMKDKRASFADLIVRCCCDCLLLLRPSQAKMRPHAAAALVLALSRGVESSEDFSTTTGIPQCAINCVLQTLADPCLGFDLRNRTCSCFHEAEARTWDTCLRRSCSFADELTTTRLFKLACDYPVRNVGRQYTVQQYVLTAVSGVAVVLRLLPKTLPGGTADRVALGLDDLCVGLAYVLLLPMIYVAATLMVDVGLGRDVWMLNVEQIRLCYYYFYLVEPLYFVIAALVRVAFLLFFLRAFATAGAQSKVFKRWGFRATIKTTIALNLLGAVAFSFAAVFQCWPISYFWDGFDREHAGSCMNNGVMMLLNSLLGIAMDSWILYLPLSQITLLTMSRPRKLQLACMFSLGFIVTIIGILRIQAFDALKDSGNPTWSSYPLVAWSTLEIHAGIICACIPGLRVFFVRTVPENFGRLRDWRASPAHGQETGTLSTRGTRIEDEGTAGAWEMHAPIEADPPLCPGSLRSQRGSKNISGTSTERPGLDRRTTPDFFLVTKRSISRPPCAGHSMPRKSVRPSWKS